MFLLVLQITDHFKIDVVLIGLGVFDSRFYGRDAKGGEENTSGGVRGFGAGMDTDAFPVGDLIDKGHKLLKLGRPSVFERVFARRDEVIEIFDGAESVGVTFSDDIDMAVNAIVHHFIADEL